MSGTHLNPVVSLPDPHVGRRHPAGAGLVRVDLIAIQELLGHSWVATMMRYVRTCTAPA